MTKAINTNMHKAKALMELSMLEADDKKRYAMLSEIIEIADANRNAIVRRMPEYNGE